MQDSPSPFEQSPASADSIQRGSDPFWVAKPERRLPRFSVRWLLGVTSGFALLFALLRVLGLGVGQSSIAFLVGLGGAATGWILVALVGALHHWFRPRPKANPVPTAYVYPWDAPAKSPFGNRPTGAEPAPPTNGPN